MGDGVKEVIIYAPTEQPDKKNRGFCFVEFEQHKFASDCKRKIQMGKVRDLHWKILRTRLMCAGKTVRR